MLLCIHWLFSSVFVLYTCSSHLSLFSEGQLICAGGFDTSLFPSHLSLSNQKFPRPPPLSVSFPNLISLPPFHLYSLTPLPSLPTLIPLFTYLHLCPNTPAGVLSCLVSPQSSKPPLPIHISCTFKPFRGESQ